MAHTEHGAPPATSTPEAKTPSVWVAVEQTWDGTFIQPVATRERGLRWLVERIKPTDWTGFVAALAREGKQDADGLPSSPTDGDPHTVLTAYWGEPIEDTDTMLEFGAGQDQTVYVARMDVLPADT